VEFIRRPPRPVESSTASLTRHQLTDWLAAAEVRGGAWWAAAMLLGLNGLRCGELIACKVEDLGNHSWHHTLKLTTTKGDRPTVVALAPPTMQAVALVIDGRARGPLLVNRAGRRMTAYNVQYLVGALARDAGIPVHLTPHGLRHSAITIGLDAGVSLRDMQDSARHADPEPPVATTVPDMPSTATRPTPSPTNSRVATEQRVHTPVLRAARTARSTAPDARA
jgi:integrase/recombinase XerD